MACRQTLQTLLNVNTHTKPSRFNTLFIRKCHIHVCSFSLTLDLNKHFHQGMVCIQSHLLLHRLLYLLDIFVVQGSRRGICILKTDNRYVTYNSQNSDQYGDIS